VEDEILDRIGKVSESSFCLRPRLVFGASPSAERWFHANKDVIYWPRWLGIRQKHVTISLSAALHPGFEFSVYGLKAFVNSHELGRKTLAFNNAVLGVGWKALFADYLILSAFPFFSSNSHTSTSFGIRCGLVRM
jgi:hypothetical protein